MTYVEFLTRSLALERGVEQLYRRLAASPSPGVPASAVAFFLDMAHGASEHCADMSARLQVQLAANDAAGGDVPPATAVTAGESGDGDFKGLLDESMRMELRAVAFYETAACSLEHQSLRMLAESLAAEERAHVIALEYFIRTNGC